MAQEWERGDFTISTDKSRLDLAVIHGFLDASYWAAGRSIETIRRSIENSVAFGVYRGERQVGFARVITDFRVDSRRFHPRRIPGTGPRKVAHRNDNRAPGPSRISQMGARHQRRARPLQKGRLQRVEAARAVDGAPGSKDRREARLLGLERGR
jgi:hypothetical protein